MKRILVLVFLAGITLQLEAQKRDTVTLKDSMKTILNNDFAAWHGLEPWLDMTTWEDVFKPVNKTVYQGMTGEKKTSMHYKLYRLASCDEPVQVWFTNKKIEKIILPYPKISNARQLLAVLGTPDTTLDFYKGGPLYKQLEWVYAGRGIALRLNTADTNDPGFNVLQVILFSSETAERYKTRLHDGAATKEIRPR